jgi:hypothetical protein
MKFIVIISGRSIVQDNTGQWVPAACLLERLKGGLQLWNTIFPTNPDLFILVSGGRGGVKRAYSTTGSNNSHPITAATVMKQYLVKHSVPFHRILEEHEATNTVQNGVFCCKLAKQYGDYEGGLMRIANDPGYMSAYDDYRHTHACFGSITHLYLITSEFHMERSKRIFEKCIQHYFGPLVKLTCWPVENGLDDKMLKRLKLVEARSMPLMDGMLQLELQAASCWNIAKLACGTDNSAAKAVRGSDNDAVPLGHDSDGSVLAVRHLDNSVLAMRYSDSNVLAVRHLDCDSSPLLRRPNSDDSSWANVFEMTLRLCSQCAWHQGHHC